MLELTNAIGAYLAKTGIEAVHNPIDNVIWLGRFNIFDAYVDSRDVVLKNELIVRSTYTDTVIPLRALVATPLDDLSKSRLWC